MVSSRSTIIASTGVLHPAYTPEDAIAAADLTVADGVVASGVEADNPVGLAAATGGGVESVVVVAVLEVLEGHLNGLGGQRVEPEAANRFVFAMAQRQDVAEDQLSFPPGISGADNFLGLFA